MSNYSINFTNGTYDLKTGIFTYCKPDGIHTGYDYLPYYENSMYAKKVDDFFEKIFPDIQTREYFLSILAECLVGQTNKQAIYILFGTGSNGKTVLMNLINYAFGSYFSVLPNWLLAKYEDESQDGIEQKFDFDVSQKDIRIGLIQEPASNGLYFGKLKSVVGRDDMLYMNTEKDELEIHKPNFVPFLTLNSLAGIDGEAALWRRLKVIPCNSVFTTHCTIQPNQFVADLNLSEEIKIWRQSFMGKLITVYNQNLNNPTAMPDNLKTFNRECREKLMSVEY